MNGQYRMAGEPQELLVPHHRRARVVIALSVFIVGLMALNWVSSL